MQSFSLIEGNVAKPLRLALGACIIQAEYGYSDEEVALQIQETAYLQFFCGYSEYNDEKLPFDPSLMVYFRKRLTPEILGEINEMIIQKAETEERSDEDDNTTPPSNSGTMIVDATCAPSQIKYPQDTELLNEASPTEQVIAIKSLEAFGKAADGKATKIIIPSEIQGLAGLVTSIKELAFDEKAGGEISRA